MSKYPDHIMEAVRGRLGLDEFDTSKDADIERRPAEKVVGWAVGWDLGDDSWADSIIRTALDCGYTISPPAGEPEWGERP